MGTFTEEACIAAIANLHPYSTKEISDVFKRCGSIDKTIDIVYNARQLHRSLMDVCDIIYSYDKN